jgi:hypothetical protein
LFHYQVDTIAIGAVKTAGIVKVDFAMATADFEYDALRSFWSWSWSRIPGRLRVDLNTQSVVVIITVFFFKIVIERAWVIVLPNTVLVVFAVHVAATLRVVLVVDAGLVVVPDVALVVVSAHIIAA